MESTTIVVYESKTKYALLNYMEIIRWYQLPFYKRWFRKRPEKYIINVTELLNQNKDDNEND